MKPSALSFRLSFLPCRRFGWNLFSRFLSRRIGLLGVWTVIASILPELSLFIYAYVRKEALLSSQIEGTQPSLSDLL